MDFKSVSDAFQYTGVTHKCQHPTLAVPVEATILPCYVQCAMFQSHGTHGTY